jgi:threonine/homoserine/homoserine lactone efflux protein
MTAYLLAGAVLGLSAGFSPGPLFALVLSQTVRYGVREGIKVAAAPLVTDLPVLLLSSLLLTRLSVHGRLLGAVSLAGAAVLAHMAYGTFRAEPRAASAPDAAPGSLARGVAVNALNPHLYVFWLTIGAPMILKGWKESPAAAVLFVAGFAGCLVGAKAALAFLADRSSRFLDGSGYRWVMRALGLLLLAFAGVLLRDGLRLFGWI